MKEVGGLGVLFPNEVRNTLRALAAALNIEARQVQIVANAMGFNLNGFEDSPFFKKEAADKLEAIEETGAIDSNYLACVRRSLGISSTPAETNKGRSPWSIVEPPLLKDPTG